jgi:hypothetical protein
MGGWKNEGVAEEVFAARYFPNGFSLMDKFAI